MKCDNCSNEASYTHADPGVNPAHYCTKCLPHWLHARAQAGHFPLVTPVVEKVEAIVETVVEAPVEKTIKKKSTTKTAEAKAPSSESN